MDSPSRLPGIIWCCGIPGLWCTFPGSLVHWLVVSFTGPIVHCNKKLFPVVVAAYLWDPLWVSRQVEFLCDNKAVMVVLKLGTSRDPNLMVLLRYLSLLAVHHSFSFTWSSVQGKVNPIAHTLSRFPISVFQATGPPCRLRSNGGPSIPPGQPSDSLSERCKFFLKQDLAPSTRRVYFSAQGRHVAFCRQDGRIGHDGILLPADEQTLILFCTLLDDTLTMVCLTLWSTAFSYNVWLWGIKGIQGSSSPTRLLNTKELMRVLHRAFDLTSPDYTMLWAACCLGFFGSLRPGEFMVNSAFNPVLHMTTTGIQADSLEDPSALCGAHGWAAGSDCHVSGLPSWGWGCSASVGYSLGHPTSTFDLCCQI